MKPNKRKKTCRCDTYAGIKAHTVACVFGKKAAPKRKKTGGYQKGHPGLRGAAASNWKGDEAGYHAIHQWLRSNFGSADRCENKLCVYPRINAANKTLKAAKYFEWALLKGKTYVHERANFIRLCISCHKRYDVNGKEIEI